VYGATHSDAGGICAAADAHTHTHTNVEIQVIAAQFMTLFCAWLNIQLLPLNIFLICLIIIGVGLLLFAIPVIPGVPIYFLCGVTITAAEEAASDADKLGGFGIAIVLGSATAFLTKMLACVLQQKVFGEQLGSGVSIRAAVTVNSEMMKAIRLMLAAPGFSFAACAILVGGPGPSRASVSPSMSLSLSLSMSMSALVSVSV